jgi:MFS family permease
VPGEAGQHSSAGQLPNGAGAVTTGWVGRVRRQGRAVIVAVLVWGAAIAGFGLTRWLPAALALLAVAGCADVISAVFRSTIIQLAAPDELRGRLMGLQMAAVTAGPRAGDAETGAVAAAFGLGDLRGLRRSCLHRRSAGPGPAAAGVHPPAGARSR